LHPEGANGGVIKTPAKIGPGEDRAEIALFDFISHATMHLPFNEGYIRTLAAMFPTERIVFHACEGQVANLTPRLTDLPNVAFMVCAPFTVPFGLSRHNPLGGWLAARTCRRTMETALSGVKPRLVVLLGVDANLCAVIGRGWPKISAAPLHMILHGQLGDTMVWRSRNPLIRAFDFIARIKRPLPPSVTLVALELGVEEAIKTIAPNNKSVVTVEHPILIGEWSEGAQNGDDKALTVAFLGNARRSKGFGVFVNLAAGALRADLRFEAIGVAAPDTCDLDVTALSRKPSRTSLSREDYVAAVQAADLICLPLHSRAYDFTASGTVSDAVAALKPLLAFRTRTLDAIVAKYGPIGWLVDSEAEMLYLLQTLDIKKFKTSSTQWVENLRKIREARRPENIAAAYAGIIDAV
jgi:glycosyltransferase involved in cell wall biosynthesis